MTARTLSSRYLEWAKLESPAPYNLASSGIAGYPISGLPVSIADLEINGPDVYGHKPLVRRLADKSGVAADQVFTTNGTSMAIHLAMAAILSPGDDVLIEHPTYGILLEVASYLSANIHRFHRRMEQGFQPDLDEIRSALTPKTRLIVLANLHNPTGAFLAPAVLTQIGEIAAEAGARVLVDEVYLDMASSLDPGDRESTRSSIHLGPQFVVVASLTKAYGLSGLRCGWVLADPALIHRIWRLDDLFNGSPPHPCERLSVIALDHLGAIAARSRSLLVANRAALDAFLDRSQVEVFRPAGGTVCFPKLPSGSVHEFCRFLRAEFQTAVVPGDFFEMPHHFRIGIGGKSEMTLEALDRLAHALDRYLSR